MDSFENLIHAREKSEKVHIKEERSDEDILDEYIFDANFEFETTKRELDNFDVCEADNATPQDDEPFSLCLVDDDGTVLEHYVRKNGRFSPVTIPKQPTAKKKRKVKKKCKNKFSQAKRITTKTERPNRDEIFKFKEYFCNLCQTSYTGRKSFRLHLSLHFTISQKHYVCSVCNYVGKTISRINSHLMLSHALFEKSSDNSERFFSCNLCDKSFYYKKDLRRHMNIHGGVGFMECGYCEYTCNRKDKLERHISSHRGNPKESIYMLQNPSKSKRNVDKNYECHHCGYTCESKAAITKHINRHLGLKRYKCPECEYTCTETGDMKKHCTIHSDERPFVCNKCSMTFKRKAHLTSHFRSKNGCEFKLKTNKKKV